jgi:hypothetical protein
MARSVVAVSVLLTGVLDSTASADALTDFEPGPADIAVSVEILSEVSICGGWSVIADVYIADSEVAWVSDMTAEILPIQCFSSLGFAGLTHVEAEKNSEAIRQAYLETNPSASHVFFVNTGCSGSCDYSVSSSFSGVGARVSRGLCGDPARLSISVSPATGDVGSFAVGVRFRGNRFLRHVAINTFNSFFERSTHGWLSFYPPVGEPRHVGFYPARYGLFYFFPGVVKEEPPSTHQNWQQRIVYPVSAAEFSAMNYVVDNIAQQRPVYNLSGTDVLGALVSSNCMDFVATVLGAVSIELPPIASKLLPRTSAPFALASRLEDLGDGTFLGCGRVDLTNESGEFGPRAEPLYDIGPDWLIVAASIPADSFSVWPPMLPTIDLPGVSPFPIWVAPGTVVRLTVNADAEGAAVTATNSKDFHTIVEPGSTIEFPINNEFGEVLQGAIVSSGGVQQYQFIFIVTPGGAPEGPVDIVLEAIDLPPVTPIVEPDDPVDPTDVSCIYDCDADGIPDCGVLPDCNNNGIPDQCEIMLGLVEDLDDDGIPDDCGCTADLAEPFGLLDLADITAFIVAFQNSDPIADLAEPYGLFDLADITAFAIAFAAGCP